MLQNVNDICKRVGKLLDDPGNTRYSIDYLIPFVDQEFATMDVELEQLGMQYVEHIAIVNVDPQVSDLTYLLADGQALASMKLPKWMKWKIQGQTDPSYQPSAYTDELDEVDANSSQGALEWVFQQGAIAITPSSVGLTLKIGFDAVSTDVYDPIQNVVRGTAHILALRVASFVASLQNGMATLQKKLETKAGKAWSSFAKLTMQKQQSKQRVAGLLHRRGYGQGAPIVTASTTDQNW